LQQYEESGDFGNFIVFTSIASDLFDIIVRHFAKIISEGYLV